MKTYFVNKAVFSALAISCGLLLLPSAVLAAANGAECSSRLVEDGNSPGEFTPPRDGQGSGEVSTEGEAITFPDTADSVETRDFDICGATVSESAGSQAQEVAMTIGSKIISQRNMNDKKSKKTAFDYRALGGAAGADDADNTMLDGSRLSLFSFADYSNRDRHTTSKSGGYEQEINSITLGFDYRLDDATFLGLSLSGSDGDSDLDTQNGGSEVSSTTFGVHGAKYWGDTFVAGLIAYGALDVDVARSTAGDSFTASTEGSYWYGDFSLGMEKNYGGLRVTPQARLLFLSGELDAYRETSASGFGIIRSIDSQDIDSTTLTLSVQSDYPMLQDWGVLLPSLRVELIATDGDAYTANGQNLNDSDKSAISSFANEADDPDSSTVLVSWGASAQFSGGFAAYAVYERLFYHDYLNRYTATVGLRYELP